MRQIWIRTQRHHEILLRKPGPVVVVLDPRLQVPPPHEDEDREWCAAIHHLYTEALRALTDPGPGAVGRSYDLLGRARRLFAERQGNSVLVL